MRVRTVRDGLGYRHEDIAAGVSLHVDRLREASGELTGELTVSRAPEGHLLVARVNLLSATTRATLAKQLGALGHGKGYEWLTTLERFFLETIALEREGEEWQSVGTMPARPAPPYLMRPFLYEHKPTILFGPGELGKSTLAATIAIAVQTGECALPGWRAERTGPVLILDWEADPADWNDALVAVASGMGIETPAIDYRTCRGTLEGQVNTIVDRVERTGAVLVIIDSAEAAMRSPREGGSDDPAKRFYDALRVIPAAALVIDHVAKSVIEHGGVGSPIGNITKNNRARATFELRSTGPDSEDGARHLVILNRKNNLDRHHAPMGVAISRSEGTIRMWEEPYQQPVAAPKETVMPLWERIRQLITHKAPMSGPTIVTELDLTGKDPLRMVENAMERHDDVFAHSKGSRMVRLWYVIEGAAESPSVGRVIAFPGVRIEEEPPLPSPPEVLAAAMAPFDDDIDGYLQ